MDLKNQDGTTNLSATWLIDNPSHPSFSKDGKTLYFQGKEKGTWNLYSYDIESGGLPTKITNEIDCTEPFCGDNLLIFNKNGQIAVMDLSTGKISALTFGKNACQPCLNLEGTKAIFVDNNILSIVDISSLSTSTLNIKGNNPALYKDSKITYELTGKGIYTKSGLAFKDAEYPSIIDDHFCLYSCANSLFIGNLSTLRKQKLFDGEYGQCVYNNASVKVATPKDGGKKPIQEDIIDSDTKRPTLTGKLVYHNYTSYDDLDSRMYIYDFTTNELDEISRSWTVVKHPMNGHFSPDGKYITFMGIGTKTNSWDIFIYELGSSKQPENLTAQGDYRDEDPKYSYNGTKICFKRNDQLAEIDVKSKNISILSHNNSDVDPYSMPYYTTDDSKLIFGGGHNPNSYIGIWDIRTSTVKKLYDKPSVVEYYPITINATSFYYTQHVSPSNNHDQLYKGYLDGSPSICLSFNKTNADYSDACPVGSGWLIFVSTRSTSKGGYDLYIAHETSGVIYPLSDYNFLINTSKNELGPDYIPAIR